MPASRRPQDTAARPKARPACSRRRTLVWSWHPHADNRTLVARTRFLRRTGSPLRRKTLSLHALHFLVTLVSEVWHRGTPNGRISALLLCTIRQRLPRSVDAQSHRRRLEAGVGRFLRQGRAAHARVPRRRQRDGRGAG